MENTSDNEISNDETTIKAKPIDRVTIGKDEATKVADWINQVTRTCGFLHLTRSDVVNFMIRERKSELSSKEISQLRAAFYDPVRHLNWITPRLKEAIQNGNMNEMLALQGEIKAIEVSAVAMTIPDKPNEENFQKQKRKRRKPDTVDVVVTADLKASTENLGTNI